MRSASLAILALAGLGAWASATAYLTRNTGTCEFAISSAVSCTAAASALGLSFSGLQDWTHEVNSNPPGCVHFSNGNLYYYNLNNGGTCGMYGNDVCICLPPPPPPPLPPTPPMPPSPPPAPPSPPPRSPPAPPRPPTDPPAPANPSWVVATDGRRRFPLAQMSPASALALGPGNCSSEVGCVQLPVPAARLEVSAVATPFRAPNCSSSSTPGCVLLPQPLPRMPGLPPGSNVSVSFRLSTLPSGGRNDPNAEGVAAGDLDGDGALDMVVANRHTYRATSNGLMMNNGRGAFAPSELPGGWTDTSSVALGDFDGDGDLDIVLGSYDASRANTLLLNNISIHPPPSNDSFTVVDLPGALGLTQAVAAGDMDLDGRLDVVVIHGGSSHQLLLGDGSGGFVATDLPSGPYVTCCRERAGVALGDLDNDVRALAHLPGS